MGLSVAPAVFLHEPGFIFQWVEGMADAGVNHYTFHVEATEDPMACIRKIREAGMLVCTGTLTPCQECVYYIL